MPRLLVCSHRGPVSYRTVRGKLVARRGGGGLINVVRPVAEQYGATWIASAITPEDASVGPRDEGACRLRFLSLPAAAHAGHYDVICNEHLWYVMHYLYDVSDTPVFDATFWTAWEQYLLVNRMYAEAISQESADVVLVQDYHLMTAAAEVRTQAALAYFHHAPWPEPRYFAMFPDAVSHELLRGMLSHDAVTFHARRWADAFVACCAALPGVSISQAEVRWQGRATRVAVAPGARDYDEVRAEGWSERTQERVALLEKQQAGRRVLVRVERVDLSKNVLRGLLAFEDLLDRRPELATQVWFLAFGYSTREKVARYRRYAAACAETAARINRRFATADVSPLLYDVQDDFHRSLAGLRIGDATLVNPVFDGLNLVAKESAVLNERDASLVLSRNAGVFEELGRAAIGINPFDVRETSAAIEEALELGDEERAARAALLRSAARAHTPEGWLRAQLAAAGVS